VIRRLAIAAALGLAVTASGCERHAPDRLPAKAADPGPSLLVTPELQKGVAALRAKAGDDAKVLELVVSPEHIVIQAQDRADPTKVQQYEYRAGKVTAPVQVRLEGNGTLDDNLFPLADAKVDVIPELAQKSVQKLDARSGKVNYVILKRNLPIDMDIQFRVFVKSPVKDGYVDADKNGKLLDD
jgi:hypothetical protein